MRGVLAHLVERNTGSVEVSGSSPLCSTNSLKESRNVIFHSLFLYYNYCRSPTTLLIINRLPEVWLFRESLTYFIRNLWQIRKRNCNIVGVEKQPTKSHENNCSKIEPIDKKRSTEKIGTPTIIINLLFSKIIRSHQGNQKLQ